ncbi:flavodoxin [Alkalihalophilus pseudofirmus]|uniref:flavodoxin domain-containing protein n=1 Tax=Alkalihalobacterium alkalinitrilicum TaxID=427920 RepID=UPI00094CCAFB|nr:flavodoxin domain-containing protein [Alkalihalobacterium alkalinitrilicum]OLO26517.1 flavodoxin [Alkalihalophilus pseudofirmus]
MKYLIVFSSSHGTTEKASQLLCKYFDGEIDLVDLNKGEPQLDFQLYDRIIIGGSIHMGSIQRKVKQFIDAHFETLLMKNIGLFLCCMNEGELAKQQFNAVYPLKLREHSKVNGLFGGELLFSQMNFLERQIIKKIKGISSDVSNLNENSIKEFANSFHLKD